MFYDLTTVLFSTPENWKGKAVCQEYLNVVLHPGTMAVLSQPALGGSAPQSSAQQEIQLSRWPSLQVCLSVTTPVMRPNCLHTVCNRMLLVRKAAVYLQAEPFPAPP